MKKRREQQKVRMLDPKARASLADAALAQNQNLLPTPQRIHHNRPFFERRPHHRNVLLSNRFDNGSAGRWLATRVTVSVRSLPTSYEQRHPLQIVPHDGARNLHLGSMVPTHLWIFAQ